MKKDSSEKCPICGSRVTVMTNTENRIGFCTNKGCCMYGIAMPTISLVSLNALKRENKMLAALSEALDIAEEYIGSITEDRKAERVLNKINKIIDKALKQ